MINRIKTTYKNLNLDIEDLAEINYFVGKNGSGKTRLLDYVLNNFEEEYKIFKIKSPSQIFNENKKFISYNTHGISANLFKTMDSFFDSFSRNMIVFKDKNRNDIYNEIGPYIKNESNIPESLSDGQLYLINLMTEICFEYISNQGNKKLILLMDEPENSLHPYLQKLLPVFFDNLFKSAHFCELQFFISTHSPFLIRGALEHTNHKIFHLEDGSLKKSFDKKKLIEQSGLPFDNVLSDLGFEMKDIYYPNCLIYVEGPTDIIYIHYWLKLYIKEKLSIKEKDYKDYQKGIDFDFVEFGGTLASHLTATFYNSDDQFDEKLTSSLQNMFSSNRNVLFITDDDDGKSHFENAKNRIEELLNQNNEKGFNNEFIKCASVKTIEDFIGDNINADKSKPKLKASVNNVLCWKDNQDLKLSDFHPKLEQELICKVYDFIKSCQNS